MSSSTNGVSKRPQVVAGEALDPIDFNALSAWGAARIHDLVMAPWMRDTLVQVSPLGGSLVNAGEGPPLYGYTHGAAPINGQLNLTFSATEGPIWQPQASSTPAIDGTTQRVLMYYITSAEIKNVAFAAADPTNPRFDAVYFRITEVDGPSTTRFFVDATGFQSGQPVVPDRRTKLEYLVVQGTPAAKPHISLPPDNSWSVWGVWYIPAAYASTFQLAHIYDYRIPFGLKRHRVGPQSMGSTGSSWTYAAAQDELQSPASASVLWATCPTKSGRVMGVEFVYRDTHPDTFNLVVTGRNVGASAGTTTSLPPGAANGQPNFGMASADIQFYTLQGGAWIHPSLGLLSPLGWQSGSGIYPNGYQLLPVWANGFGSTAADSTQRGGAQTGYTGSDAEQRHVRMWMDSAGSNRTIVSAIFDIAGA